MDSIQVPLLDLKSQYAAMQEKILRAVEETLASGQWVLGPKVQELEIRLAGRITAKHAVGVASGTDAILLSLKALGCGPGDEVICPAFTFFATAGAVSNCGATPVFVEIEERSFNLDPAALAAAFSERTKAVVPVHLFGQAAEMDPILDLCRSRGVAVVEDAAQSIDATYKGQKAGAIGDTGCFSFYPTKNLGSAGDGGLITTSRDDLADLLRMLRVHGARPKYYNQRVGLNSRLDALQAAILLVKIEELDRWAEARAAHARVYDEAFAGLDGIEPPARVVDGRHVYNQYTIRVTGETGARDALQAALKEAQVGTEIYYPYPLHLLPAFAHLGYREGQLPRTERAAREVLSLPIFPEMSEAQQSHVIDVIRGWTQRR